jgi:hypothetical protein
MRPRYGLGVLGIRDLEIWEKDGENTSNAVWFDEVFG